MILLALLAAAAPVDCGARTSQTDMNICFAQQAKRADAALNAAWGRLTASAGASKPAYLAAQRLWLRYRDAECAAEGKSSEGGTLHGTVVSSCVADLTDARAKRIDQLASQPH